MHLNQLNSFRQILLSFVIFLVLSSSLPAYAKPEEIYIGVVQRDDRGYFSFIESKGGDPIQITDFYGGDRSSIGPVLVQQALSLGGFKDPIKFRTYPNYVRALQELRKGNITILGQSVWEDDGTDQLYMSQPVIADGEFKKAVYGRADNKGLMASRSLNNLKKFTALTGLRWSRDIAALKKIKVKQVIEAPLHDRHPQMVLAGRADFSMLELAGVDIQKRLLPGLKLVEGLYITLEGSRHFAVSKNHPLGHKAFDALQKGLKIMLHQGIIAKAHREIGFIRTQN
jgi:hypothetical protein